MSNRGIKEESRREYFKVLADEVGFSNDDLKTGCLMRIADATEAMALRHTELIKQRDRFEQWYKEEQERRKHLERSNAALRGHLKRGKNKCAAAQAKIDALMLEWSKCVIGQHIKNH